VALADGAAEATLGAVGVGEGELEPQLSHPASETTTTGMESSMSRRTRTSLESAMVTRVSQRLSFLALLLGLALGLARPAHAEERVPVLVPDGDNLQYAAFWTAQGAGYFASEGVAVDLVVPELPAQAIAKMIAGEAPVAVLPPPQYLELVADRVPIVLVANLLRNDPINLAVRRSVFEQRAMSATAPLRERLLSLKGLRIGVAPGPPTRLRALFASVGLDADALVRMVIRHGKDQNEAFGHDECDALFAHTPYLETALDDQDAVILVNQSGGEVPALAMRQIHALTARRDYLTQHRATVVGMVRAVARAETLLHTDLAAAEDAVMHALPALDRRHLHTILRIYQPAIPETPAVGTDGLAPGLALFPASRTPPSLEGVALADFVDSSALDEANGARVVTSPAATPTPARASHTTALSFAVGAAVAVVVFVLLRRKGGSRDHQEPKPSASSRTG
jgi:ABC-type nitrate/sulfonate/bicarbonate transport system substrate-binding protein